ncbi:MAG: SDR family oxidoreductase, partial [Nakamurella sp.]
MTILVTGSTGQLGSPTLAALRATGQDARGISRRGRDGSTSADLATGAGVAAALRGVDTVVHCAQTRGKRDPQLARTLVESAKAAGVDHLVLISIVGIDQISMPYYRQRVEIEHIVEESGLPVTIQRATQFHSLIDGLFSVQRFMPVLLLPRSRFQPIAVPEVADRLSELAIGSPQGRVTDVGGPERLDIRELHAKWERTKQSRRGALVLPLPGKALAGYDNGANFVPGEPYGRSSFDD